MMGKKLIIFVSIISLLFVAGCGVKDTVYHTAEREKILQQVAKSDMSPEDRLLLSKALLNEAFGGDKLEGKTLGAIVSEQKKIDLEKAQKEEEAKIAKAKLEKELAGYITVGIESKESHPKNIYANVFSPFVTMKVLIVNNSQKDIQGFKGYFTIKDIFNENIMKTGYSNDDGIKAAGKSTVYLSRDINQFISEDKKLYNTDLSKLKFEWTTTAIVFTDGSSIGVNNNKL